MVDYYVIAIIVEGVVILCLALVVLAHSRLLGLLHMRLGPAGARALADGPDVGTRIDELSGRTLDGGAWKIGFPRPSESLLIFISPQCETCNALMPHVKDFVRHRTGGSLTLVSTVDDQRMNSAYVAWRAIDRIPYVLGEAMAKSLDIEATPYALRIDEHGVVRAKGIVNTRENLVMMLQQDMPRPERDVPERDFVDENHRGSTISTGEANAALASGH
jgi:methylamine dehydrogenase accessory protein MauD